MPQYYYFQALTQAIPQPDPVIFYKASTLPTTSSTTSWPNSGTGGSQYDLVAESGGPTYQASGGPGGTPCVRFTGNDFLKTTVNQPATGASSRVLLALVYVESIGQRRNLFGTGTTDVFRLADLYVDTDGTPVMHISNASTAKATKLAVNTWCVVGYRAEPDSVPGGALISSFNGGNDPLTVKVDCTNQGGGATGFDTAPNFLRLGGGIFSNQNGTSPFRLAEFRQYGALTDGQLATAVMQMLKSVPVTPPPTGGSNTYVPVYQDLNYVSYEKTNTTGVKIWNPFYELHGSTTSDTLQLGIISELSNEPLFADLCGVALSVNGGAWTPYVIPQNSGTTEVLLPTITLPGASGSTRTLAFRGSYVEGKGLFTGGDFMGATLTKVITSGAPFLVNKLTPKANRHFLATDSLHGNHANPVFTTAWPMQVRDNAAFSNTDVVVHGWGQNVAWYSFATESTLAQYVNATSAFFSGATGTCRTSVHLGTNDQVTVQETSQHLATGIGLYIQGVQNALPSAIIDVHTVPYQEKDQSRVAEFKAAVVGIHTTYPTVNVYDDDGVIVSPHLLADKLHWDSTNHGYMANNELQIVAGAKQPIS